MLVSWNSLCEHLYWLNRSVKRNHAPIRTTMNIHEFLHVRFAAACARSKGSYGTDVEPTELSENFAASASVCTQGAMDLTSREACLTLIRYVART